MTTPIYDRIGRGYSSTRQPDPRIARQILDALGDAPTVLNAGAGTGSYEPEAARVVAVEPSGEMIAQRRSAAPVVRAVAEALPFAGDAFDAAMAVLTIHHWPDWRAGVAELRRVAASRVVILTWDPEAGAGFWLLDYFPGILALDRDRFPALDALLAGTGGRAEVVPVPHDCQDGFLGGVVAAAGGLPRRRRAARDVRLRAAAGGGSGARRDASRRRHRQRCVGAPLRRAARARRSRPRLPARGGGGGVRLRIGW